MSREITDHKIGGADDVITVTAQDVPGPGGACHIYSVEWKQSEHGFGANWLQFQDGPSGAVGVNGLTNESLLAVVLDRLRSFQAGPVPCDENAVALQHVQFALNSLKQRTRNRIARGVEGTLTK